MAHWLTRDPKEYSDYDLWSNKPALIYGSYQSDRGNCFFITAFCMNIFEGIAGKVLEPGQIMKIEEVKFKGDVK